LTLQRIGLLLGILLFVCAAIMQPLEAFREAADRYVQEQQAAGADAMELARSMQIVAGLMLWMVVWWLTEAIPLPWTALLPLCVLPALSVVGISKVEVFTFSIPTVARQYVNPVVLLFFGGFLLAGAMRRWHLDRRITLWFLTRGNLAKSARTTLFGLMAVTAFLSMWIANTATCAMMLPLSLGILEYIGAKPGKSPFGTSLMLGIAWSASIGGVGSLIGTPFNGIAVGVLNDYFAHDPSYQRITFLDWLKFGLPLVAAFLPVAWFVLVRTFPSEVAAFEGGKERLMEEFHRLGKMTRGERGSIVVFLTAVVLWLTLPFREEFLPASLIQLIRWLDEYVVGLMAGLSLFLIPVDRKRRTFLLHWKDFRYVEWGALAIVGGRYCAFGCHVQDRLRLMDC